MTAQSVCAVVVTYHPGTRVLDNIVKLLAQVQGLVVVDNGSQPEEIRLLRTTCNNLKCTFIENGENLGIAEALNQGVRWAKNNDFPWVILFDQDSTITSGFVDQLFAAWVSHSERERVGSIHPRYRDRESGKESLVRRTKDGGPISSMTSGALMPVWVFDKIGWFASEYFIDWVDHEYCFRIRAAGYLVADSQEAVLLHTPGNPKQIGLLGFSCYPTYHNATRRYYISRNRIVFSRQYFRVFPAWVLRFLYDGMRDTVKCFVGEPDRGRKFRNVLLGAWDGLTGRMGKREGL